MPDDLHLDIIPPATEAELCHPWTEAPKAENPLNCEEVLASDAEIARLAALKPLDYDKVRVSVAKKMGVRTETLDAEVAKRRPKSAADDGTQGRAVEMPKIEPWLEPVAGTEVLDDLARVLREYIIVSDVQADATALWITHTHAHHLAETSPKLVLKSPQKRSGKTRLIEVLSRVTARPLPISGIKPSALLRLIELHRPSLLLDEIDAAMKQGAEMAEALRGIINSGFDRTGARFITNVPLPGGGWEPREFSTWCPQVLSGIGKLPDTIRDRSIEIDMQRKLRTEKVKRLRRRDGADLLDMARRLARWVDDVAAALANAEPDTPAGLNDRAADAWEPLFAIADQAGGDWPRRARKAALALSGDEAVEDENIGTMLLADIREIMGDKEAIFSATLAEALGKMKDRPWADWKHGKPIDENAIRVLLKDYLKPGRKSRTVRVGPNTSKGYRASEFAEAFARYLPPAPEPPSQPVTPSLPKEPATFRQNSPSQKELSVTARNCENPSVSGECDGVTAQTGDDGAKGEHGAPWEAEI